jgi:hypothetical protein
MDATFGTYLKRGLAAGAIGGAAAALFIRFVTETPISSALRFEDATGIGLPPGEAAEFSRGTQHWGGMAAAVLYGCFLGVILAVVVAALHHRLTGRNEFERIGKVALAGFVALTLIPALKYPPNPPTVGNPDTIGSRSTEFMLLMLASVVVVVAIWRCWRLLGQKGWDGAPRFLAGGAVAVVLVTFLLLAWPASPDPIVPPDNEAAPALQVAGDAPQAVLDQVLQAARDNDDPFLRDSADPSRPLDLTTVGSGAELRGVPAAINTTKLVHGAYTTIIWRFRLQSIAGVALLWAVLAGVFGLLADRQPSRRSIEAMST